MEFGSADLIVLGVFLVFVIWKAYRGLYDSLMPLAVAVLAFVGARFLARALSPVVTEWVWPWVRERFLDRVDMSALPAQGADSLTRSLEELLPETVRNLAEKLGLDLGGYVETALGSAAAGAGQAAESAALALLRTVTERAVRALVFLASWGLLSLLLTLVKNALGLVTDLPLLRGLDALGGAVLGAVLCAVLLYVLLWAAYLLGVTAIVDFARKSAILRWIGKL